MNDIETTGKEFTYSGAISEIESILARLNGDNPDIDRLAADVKRATELIKMCRERLHKVEAEVSGILSETEQ